MVETETKKIYYEIEQAIGRENLSHSESMPGDRWLLSSAMQKAIRRGENERAGSAAFSLWRVDRKSLWRRLHIIALEDVGAGDVHAATVALAATVSPSWRKEVGDLSVAVHAVRQLCKAVKSRLADAAYILAERSDQHAETRRCLAKMDDGKLADCAADEQLPLIERIIAIWLLAGTKKYPSDFMPSRAGSLEKSKAALRNLDAPESLIEFCIRAVPLSCWPLALFVPLIWQEAQKHNCDVKRDEIPTADAVEGLPVYAADSFTRIGKACIRELQAAVPSLKSFSTQQIGLAVFYADGGRTDRTIIAPYLDKFQNAGELADLASAGLPADRYDELRKCLADNTTAFNEIRIAKLSSYLSSYCTGVQI